MAKGFDFFFVLLLVACHAGVGSAAHLSLTSHHEETSTSLPKGSDPCEPNPCADGTTCEPRFNDFICWCLAGHYYNYHSKTCEKAKFFPGRLILPGIDYHDNYTDKTSIYFENTERLYTTVLIEIFKDYGADFFGALFLKFQREEKWLGATLDIGFNTTAVITTEEVKERIDNASCPTCSYPNISFIYEGLCKNDSRYPCETATTESCSSEDGFYYCSCKDGFVPTNTSDRICIEEDAKTTPTQPTTSPDPCGVNPCGKWSTCQPLANETFVCLCLAGDWYNNIRKSCEKAKVFPGQLILPELKYEAQMNNMSSAQFLKGSKEIIDSLNDVFQDSVGYLESSVLELEENKPKSRLWSRAESGVVATVDIIFNPIADTTTEEVENKIKTASCTTCTLPGANFTGGDLCKKDDRYPCDEKTTICTPKDGSYNCTCMDDYIETAFSGSRMCIGCPSGQKVVNSKCVDCPFGYSGFNCNDSWHLILVIVGSILGILLLITLILLPIVACISSKKSSKKNKNADMGNPAVDHSATETPFVHRGLANSQSPAVNGSTNNSSNTGLPRMQLATTPGNWDRTKVEMMPRNSRQNLSPVGGNSQLYRDEYNTAPYAQTPDRPHINPYAQRRPQINPYAMRQGQSNFSYNHDDGRRFNY